jgi:septum formation inhibitor-activating ATPase MinD
LEVDKSLGSIFAAQRISVNLIKHNLTTLKRLPHLTMLGLRKKENEYTYAPCTKQQAEELIRGLREIVPYVVIDCSSYIANDILSAVALMEADSVLQLASCDLKSVGYLSSQLPLLGELKWDKDKQYRVGIQHQALSGGRPHRSGAGQRSLPAAVFAGAGGAVSGR